jgi:hypothetical protein
MLITLIPVGDFVTIGAVGRPSYFKDMREFRRRFAMPDACRE